ncbi:SDR family NAD(P)-dependent oxidoreductase [Terriglobus roseus]|uniref:3-oxoacyl-[acyl-carrier protein] reductase/pteridine reductase n=1 Tax=Terriglobus roseus TaxID=392734 RepID=A0A1H4JEV7_9BACT|nr:SDR family NAD(P)-dependent oxidoreductase [Terriglobus roseus]SEB44615.1 3-oxoacyl-[acyl-carrier protein] reductase/pteridine reductase [Terriglobus roseus]
MTLPLSGTRALVTGGVRRLGRAFALALADAGADVVVTSRSVDADADAVLQQMRGMGVRAHSLVCDVRSPDSVTRSVAEAADFLGGLDLLINNAGMFESAPLELLTPEQWDDAYSVNARGPFLVAQAALPHLRACGHGRIINIGSLGGIKPWTTHGHYCASKAALHMLSQTMAKAWAPEVSVNCVAPGMIRFPDEPERLAGKTPMGRDGAPEDVVSAVLYFATAPAFITGQVMAVDGGLSLI